MYKSISLKFIKDFLIVDFSDKCVFCGKDKSGTIPLKLSTYSPKIQKQLKGKKYWSKDGSQESTFNIPYCQEHYNFCKRYGPISTLSIWILWPVYCLILIAAGNLFTNGLFWAIIYLLAGLFISYIFALYLRLFLSIFVKNLNHLPVGFPTLGLKIGYSEPEFYIKLTNKSQFLKIKELNAAFFTPSANSLRFREEVLDKKFSNADFIYEQGGVDINFVDYSGKTLLISAIEKEDMDIIDYLLAKNINVSMNVPVIEENDAMDALDMAKKTGNVMIVNIIQNALTKK